MKFLILFALVGAAVANPVITEDAETRGLFSNLFGSPTTMAFDVGLGASKLLLKNIGYLNNAFNLAGMDFGDKANFALCLAKGDMFGAMKIVGVAAKGKIKDKLQNLDILTNLSAEAAKANGKIQDMAKEAGAAAATIVASIGQKDVPEGAEAAATEAANAALTGPNADPAEALRAAINAIVNKMTKNDFKFGAIVSKGLEVFNSATLGLLNNIRSSAIFSALFGGSTTSTTTEVGTTTTVGETTASSASPDSTTAVAQETTSAASPESESTTTTTTSPAETTTAAPVEQSTSEAVTSTSA